MPSWRGWQSAMHFGVFDYYATAKAKILVRFSLIHEWLPLLRERLSIGDDNNQHVLSEIDDFLRWIAGERR